MDPSNTPPQNKQPKLYSSNIVNTYLRFVRAKYLHVNLGEVLLYAGMEEYQVKDDGHWFTQDQIDRFYSYLVRVTGNKNLAREAGRHTSSTESLGRFTRYALGLVGPGRVFEMITELARRYTRSAHYESHRNKRTEFELTVTPFPGVRENEHQCENRMGYFEAIVRLFSTRLPKIEHPECVFRGGRSCRYLISWNESSAQVWKTIRNVTAVLTVLTLPLFLVMESVQYWPLLAAVSLLGILGISHIATSLEKSDLKTALANLRTTTDQLLDEAERHYDYAQMVNEIGRIIGKYTQIDTLLSQVTEVLGHRLDYDRGMILLVSSDGSRLE